MKYFLSLIIGYILGSILFAVIIAKIVKGIDITKVGSKNPGAGNVAKQVGKLWGIIVWLLDTVKGIISMFTAAKICTNRVFITPDTEPLDCFFIGLTGIAAFCGHCWPLFHKFKGGRGASTACGVFLYIMPKFLPIGILTYFILQKRRKISTLILGFAICLGILIWMYWAQRVWFIPFLIVFLIMAVITNIKTIKEIRCSA